MCFGSPELLSYGLMVEHRESEKGGEVCNHLIQTYTHRILLHLATVIVFAISIAPKTDSLLSQSWPNFSVAVEE